MLIFIAEDMAPFSLPVPPPLVCQRREWHSGIINILTVFRNCAFPACMFEFACSFMLSCG